MVMRGHALVNEPIRRSSGLRTLRRWSRDERGVTAIEFAIVAPAFFMFVFGIIGVGLHFFTLSTLEHAVASAARTIRTGEAQTGGVTVGEFKQMVVDNGSGLINPSKLQIHVQSKSNWADLTPPKCLTADGKMRPPAGGGGDAVGQYAGSAGAVVLVTACYEWDIAKALGFLGFGNMEGGSSLIQAATTFRTEPYQ
jgi:Flp pilus assembly pilin Flp